MEKKYKNGRTAQIGDKVSSYDARGINTTGILAAIHDTPEADGRIVTGAEIKTLPVITLANALHADDEAKEQAEREEAEKKKAETQEEAAAEIDPSAKPAAPEPESEVATAPDESKTTRSRRNAR